MNKKIELIGNFASDWIRYSDYEYKITEEDELYIVPTEDAVFTMYNPFDVADDIIVDIIRIGQEALQDISKETKEMKLKKEILEFVKKYGLLGLIYSSVYN
ncbi:CGNR zinc finger domain-containing protein, partial [Clostridioides difficile]|nr:CGNR zinc finger domain-containing protein [Clostridioides difficile]